MTQEPLDILYVLDKNNINIEDIQKIQKEFFLFSDQQVQKKHLEEYIEENSSKKGLKIALVYWLLNNFTKTEELLKANKDEPSCYLLAKLCLSKGRKQESLAILEKSLLKYPDSWELQNLLIHHYLSKYDCETTQKLIKNLPKNPEKKLEVRFLKAHLLEIQGHYEKAVLEYEEILEEDPDHIESHFRLGFHHNLRGDSEQTLEHYKACQSLSPLYINAWINLGVFYEDGEQYEKATFCFQEVLNAYPNHEVTRLYLEDCQSAMKMYYDEDRKKRTDKRKQVLQIPISDFELSVRARNCLNKMNIRTIEDLIKKTEDELLLFKNFGENSLKEIKEILSQYKLSLSDGRKNRKPLISLITPKNITTDSLENADTGEMRSRPITDFDFAKRSINCMKNLGIYTMDDLLNKSELELMHVKNFGRISLVDIKDKLTQYGLSLKDS